MDNLLWECKYCHIKVPMKPNEFPIYCRCGNIGTLEEAGEFDPSIWKKAKNFAKATVRDIKTGFKRLTQEQFDRRLEMCKGCSYVLMRDVKEAGNIIDKIVFRCRHKKCGCFLQVKAWRTSEQCPMNHWEKIE